MRFLLRALIILAVPAACAGPIFTLYPNNTGPVAGNLLAGNGRTLGWGVQVANDNSGWLVIDSVSLAGDPAPFLVTSFRDLLSTWVSNNNYAFAPNQVYTLNWSAGTAGLAEFAFPSSAFGFTGPTVSVQINYDLFDVNPFSGNPTLDVPASAQVSVALNEADPPSSGTPEPATGLLVAVAVAWGGLRMRNGKSGLL